MTDELIEVRFHGRGGQGAWTASLLLAQAGLKEERYIQSFPAFGPERAEEEALLFEFYVDSPLRTNGTLFTLPRSRVITGDEGAGKTALLLLSAREGWRRLWEEWEGAESYLPIWLSPYPLSSAGRSVNLGQGLLASHRH